MDSFRNITERLNVIKNYLVPGARVAVFDTETTGLASTDKIIQFSCQMLEVQEDLSTKLIEARNQYINPEMKLPFFYDKKGNIIGGITELTGITDKMLADKPTEKDVFRFIADYLATADVWVAYNAPFDIKKLKETAERVEYMLDERITLDALVMARDLIPANEIVGLDGKVSYKLCNVTAHLFPEDNTSFHNAANDVDATVRVFEKLVEMYRNLPDQTDMKRSVCLEYASYYNSPYGYDHRVRLKLSEGDFGDIYYDCTRQPYSWKCKKTSKAKKLFEDVDMADIEAQFMEKYGYRFGRRTVDEAVEALRDYYLKKNA